MTGFLPPNIIFLCKRDYSVNLYSHNHNSFITHKTEQVELLLWTVLKNCSLPIMLQVNSRDTGMDSRVKSDLYMTFIWRPEWQVCSDLVYSQGCLILFDTNNKATKGWRHLRDFVENFRKTLQIVLGSWMFNLNDSLLLVEKQLFTDILLAVLKNFQNSQESNGGGTLAAKDESC